jgi:uncharacterized membrane protein
MEHNGGHGFGAFSVCVMQALAHLPPAQGIAAMQSINVAVLNPVFLAAFFGTAATCVPVVIASLFRWHDPGAAYLLVGAALYLVGTILVTVVCNVPRNNALAAVTLGDPDSDGLWARYLAEWTTWNHVQTATALAAAVSLTLGICR